MKPLRIILVEDEPVTARNLAHLLQKIDAQLSVCEVLNSVESTVSWFSAHNDYDLVFMDIQLSDGISFDIFKEVKILKPVIFVTAYDNYAIEAFKNNGIDYILKPFDEVEVERSLGKYKTLTGRAELEIGLLALPQLIDKLNAGQKAYKKSFLVHYRDKLIPVDTTKIAWFYTSNELVYAQTADSRQYVIDFNMEQLEQQLDPALFYRANRQFIVNRNEITEVEFYFNGRLVVKIKPTPPESIIISKARTPEFKSWMDS